MGQAASFQMKHRAFPNRRGLEAGKERGEPFRSASLLQPEDNGSPQKAAGNG